MLIIRKVIFLLNKRIYIKVKKAVEETFFENYLRLFLSAREKVLNNFTSTFFLIKNLDKIPKHEPTPELAKEPT